MRLETKKRINKLTSLPRCIWTLLICVLGLIVVAVFSGIYPFGDRTLLISDLSAQYAPMTAALRYHFVSGQGLDYSYLPGLGQNAWGIFVYYLTSPFVFLSLLFPVHAIGEAMALIIALKIALAGMLMTLYLNRLFGRTARFTILLGVAYAFSSYTMAYYFNIMWLDGLMLLGLLMYFVEDFLDDKKAWWKVVLIFTALLIFNFYTAYMIGLFSLAFVFVRIYCWRPMDTTKLKAAHGTFLRYIGSLMLAAFMSAIFLFPGGLAIYNNQFALDREPSDLGNFLWISFIDHLLPGSIDHLSNAKPYVYASLLVLFLVILFFLHPKIAVRKKVVGGLALAFFLISFHFSPLNLVWHFFSQPKWFPHRFAFLFVFSMLLIAGYTMQKIRQLPARAFVILTGVFVLLLLLVAIFGDLKEDTVRFYLILVFGLAQIAFLYLLSCQHPPEALKRLARLMPIMIALFFVVEMIGYNARVIQADYHKHGLKRHLIVDSIQAGRSLIDEVNDEDFFRIEATYDALPHTFKFGLNYYLGKPGISVFSSCANRDAGQFLSRLGYDTNYNYATAHYVYASVVPDALLGIRYHFSDMPGDGRYVQRGFDEGQALYLQESPRPLGLMYWINNKADGTVPEAYPNDVFLYQNEMVASLFFMKPVYYPVASNRVAIYNAIEKEMLPNDDEKKDYLTYLRINDTDKLRVTYEVAATSEDPLYLCLPFDGRGEDATIYFDGDIIARLSNSYYSRIIKLGYLTPGETYQLAIEADEDSFSSFKPLFYHCDETAFIDAIDAFGPHDGIVIEQAVQGYIVARVRTDHPKDLLVTLPSEDGWTLRINGEKMPIEAYQDTLMRIKVLEGEHEIELTFRAPGYDFGRMITAVAGIIFLVCLIADAKDETKADKQHGKKEA